MCETVQTQRHALPNEFSRLLYNMGLVDAVIYNFVWRLTLNTPVHQPRQGACEFAGSARWIASAPRAAGYDWAPAGHDVATKAVINTTVCTEVCIVSPVGVSV